MADKTIAIVGATGAQGGGLARAILDDPESGFAVRALTRKPDSDAARALADRGAEVVQADLDDPASLGRAFADAWGAYCVTNFWEHFSPEKEKEQARNLARAAKEAGLNHVIWSTLDDTRRWVPVEDDRMPTLMERYKVPHYDAKGEADAYFREAGVPTTYLLTVFYWENLIHFGMGPKRADDGVLDFVLPMADARLPSIGVEDIGKSAFGVFREGAALVGERVGIAGGHPTGQEMADGLSAALGEEVRYRAISADAYRQLGFPGAEDLGNMFQFKVEFEEDYCGSRSIERARELNPELRSFDEWARENAERIPLE